MKGSHHILIETKKIRYEFDIKRNITIIQGDSATGKTTLASLIAENARHGMAAGIRIESDVPCVTFEGNDLWEERIKNYENTIIIIDEGNSFIYSTEFAGIIRDSSNYYVLITRKPIDSLPYSINEIYGIRTTGKYHYPEKIFNELYPLFENKRDGKESQGKRILITEDSKAGYQFFSKSLSEIECVSAEGNANVYNALRDRLLDYDEITIIADGAAFGAFIGDVLTYSKYGNVALYFPESFEWMILKSGVVDIDNVNDILDRPEDYIESKYYFSWERYFTEVLRKNTENDSIRGYSKNELKPFYYEGKNKESILNVIPEEIRRSLI